VVVKRAVAQAVAVIVRVVGAAVQPAAAVAVVQVAGVAVAAPARAEAAVVKGGAAAIAAGVRAAVAGAMIAVVVASVKVEAARLTATQATGVVTAIETATGIATATETKTVTEVVIMIEIGIKIGIGIRTATEIAIATAHTKARGFTTLQIMVTTATVLTLTSAAIRTAYLRALVMGGGVKATSPSALTSTDVVTLVSSQSSARAIRISRHIGTVFCAGTRKVSKIGKAISSAGAFIDSPRQFLILATKSKSTSMRVLQARA
jgi:hypothetical protein